MDPVLENVLVELLVDLPADADIPVVASAPERTWLCRESSWLPRRTNPHTTEGSQNRAGDSRATLWRRSASEGCPEIAIRRDAPRREAPPFYCSFMPWGRSREAGP